MKGDPMDPSLARGMARLLAGTDAPSAEEIADALWVARVIGRTSSNDAVQEGELTQADVATADAGAETPAADLPGNDRASRAEGRWLARLRDTFSERENRTQSADRPSAPTAPTIPLYPVSASTDRGAALQTTGTETGTVASEVPGAVVRVQREPALSESLAISRSLRPLKRHVRAPGMQTLDEAATATATCEAEMLMPAWLPRTERWLSVDLIVDTGPSMVMWRQLAAELRTLLEGHGAFRTVRTWALDSGGAEPRLSPFRRRQGPGPNRTVPLEQLADPTGRRVLLLLTDGVGPLWHRGGLNTALCQWSRKRPVAVLQVLPRSMWHRTALIPVPVLARPGPPGHATPVFRTETAAPGTPLKAQHDHWVPVMELDADWIAPWAQVVAGRTAGWTPMLAVPTGTHQEDSGAAPDEFDEALSSLDPAALVERFRSEASPSAFELAGYLAATPMVLPVMRLVQRTMMPRSKPAHLAEVFLSGLLTSADGAAPDPGQDPDLRLYDFRPGVRDLLLNTLTRQESLRTLDVVGQVSGRVAQRLGGSLDFRALIPATGAKGTWRLPEGSLPFARVAVSVLAGLGSEYRATATTLAQEITVASGAPTHRERRPRATPRTTLTPSPSRSKVRQPMLFVGLGGTGALVGAELESRLRADLCGPDGTSLQGRLSGHAPYQLPDFLQFVYADYSEDELQRLPQFTVDPSLRAAYARTSRVTHDLLPNNFDSSPEVTRMLRVVLRDEVADWLPPPNDEPRVSPLRHGVGQLPTVGRAALFATLRDGPAPILTPLLQAFDAILKSAGALADLGGGPINGCDVFVAFSVAGGTGTGIFLDYLHLINHAIHQRGFVGVRIYPLVVMPSAFSPERGGGRAANLNAARALVDLYRLVDEQNAPSAGIEIGDLNQSTRLGIRYPGATPIRLRTGILPTAFLFSPAAGIRPDDLRRSIVSLAMTLIGTEPDDTRTQGRTTVVDDDFATFAASFINRGVHRRALSPTGIGRRSVSTSLVASMMVPMDQLADLMAGRLLREAVTELVEAPHSALQDTTGPMIRQLFIDSGLKDLWHRPQLEVTEPDQLPRGVKNVEQALGERISDMQRLLDDLRARVVRQTADLADQFAPRYAIEKLLQTTDLFHADRIIRGSPGNEDPIARLGFLGMLDDRSYAPLRPPGVDEQPPKIPRIKGRRIMSRTRWGFDDVQEALQEQDAWYQWRCRTIWHEAWREQQHHWRAPADAAGTEIARMVGAFRAYSEDQERIFVRKVLELYEDRTGLSYLLPPQRNLNQFYEDLVARLIRREGLRESDGRAALLLELVDRETWPNVHALSRRSPDSAVVNVKAQLEGHIRHLLAENGAQEERPLLPSVATLLAAAVGAPDATDQVSTESLDLFGRKLTALLSVGFIPEGTGPLRVLVTYPRVEAVDEVEQYLGEALRLPPDARNSVEYRGGDSDSITVILLRSGMGLTEVPEARKVLAQWTRAKEAERPEDMLRWRQRLGYRDSWIVSSEEDQRIILHRLLCCMWNGQVDVVDGDRTSPHRIRLELFPETGADVPGIQLKLDHPPGGVSSWAGLLRSYERWTLLDDQPIVADYCRELMGAQPLGLTSGGRDPHALFVELVEEIAPRQLDLLTEHRERDGERDEGWVGPLWEFWAKTLPAALDTEFADQRTVQPTLRTLLEHVRGSSPTTHLPESEASSRPVDDEADWGTTRHTTGADESGR